MGRIACVACFMLALLTILSIAPASFLFWVCEFAPRCFSAKLWYLMIGPVRLRALAIVIVLGPLLCLVTYVLALCNCQRSRDVLDRSRHPFA